MAKTVILALGMIKIKQIFFDVSALATTGE